MRIAAATIALSLSACSPYTLPDPPPVEDRGEVALNPALAQRLSAERFIEARRAVLSLYEAFNAERWDDALELLSNETRILLASGGSGEAAQALAAGTVSVDGVQYHFSPVDLFLLAEPEAFEDDWESQEQSETSRRKELFIVSGEDSRRVVVILEGDAWRVHMRRWPMDRLSSRPEPAEGG